MTLKMGSPRTGALAAYSDTAVGVRDLQDAPLFTMQPNSARSSASESSSRSQTEEDTTVREILVKGKKCGFCAEVVHRGQPYLILENALKPIFVPFGPKKNQLCFIKFDFLPFFCLPGLVPNSRFIGFSRLSPFATLMPAMTFES